MSVHFPSRELLIIETCFPSQLAKDAILKQVLSVSVIKKKEEEKKTSGRLAAISSFSVSRKQKDLSGNKRTDSPNTHI